MSKTWIVATLVCAIALVACDSRTRIASVTTPGALTSPTPASAQPTATPAPIPAPGKPESFSDYAPAMAKYLTANPAAAAGANCLADLIAAWKMPLLSQPDACIAANTDGDPANELVAVITTKLTTAGATTDTQFEIVVFDPTSDGFIVGYESDPVDVIPPGRTDSIRPLLAAGDLNKDGGGEFAYETANKHELAIRTYDRIAKGTPRRRIPIKARR